MNGPASKVACALCGTTTGPRVVDRGGCACNTCLGEALRNVVAGDGEPGPVTVTASDRCLLCSDVITKGSVVAVRGPYKLCGECLSNAAGRALDAGRTTMTQVRF